MDNEAAEGLFGGQPEWLTQTLIQPQTHGLVATDTLTGLQ